MAPLTWRNVDAPNFAGAVSALEVSGRGFNNASEGLINAVDSFQDGRTQAESARLITDVLRQQDPTKLRESLANGTLLSGYNPRYLSADALDFLGSYEKSLLGNVAARQNIANGGQFGKRGSGGRGRGGNDDFVDVNKTGVRGYIDENGQVTATPVAGAESSIPAAIVPATTTPTAKSLSAIGEPVISTQDLPVSESEAGAPQSMVQIAPTMENAAALANVPTDVTGSPAASDISSFGSTQPVPGPIRVGTPKGKDGFNQRNFELAQDAINSRNAAYAGDPTGAIESVANNPRMLLNGTVSNLLTLQDNTYKAAEQGQQFVRGASEQRKRDRDENDELRGRASTEIARVAADDAIINSVDPQSAKVKLAQLYNANEIDLDAFKKGLNRVDESSESFAVFNDPTAPTADTPVAGSGDQPVDPNAKPEEGKAKGKQTTPVAIPPKKDALAGTAIAKSVEQFNDQINLDQSGDLNANFRTKFNQAAGDTSTPAEVANRAIGENGAFPNGNKDDYLNALNDVMERYRVTAPVASLMLESAPAGRSRTSRALLGNWFTSTIQVDSDRLDQLGQLITDPATGRVRAELLQENDARRTSNNLQKDINTKYDEAGRAQAALNRAIGLVGQGRDPEKIKLKELEAKAKSTQEAVTKAIADATRTGGTATGFRGDFEQPAQAEVVPNSFARQRPAETIIPQEVTARATAIYQRLLDQSNRKLTRREELDLRRQAREQAIQQVNDVGAAELLARAARGG